MGIYKRKDSPYYWFRKTVNGKQYRRATDTASKMRAQELYGKWVAELKEKVDKGEPVITVKVEPKAQATFRELAGRYVEFTKDRLKSARNIGYIVKDMVFKFQDKPLENFGVSDIENLQNDKLSDGLSIRTANYYSNVLKTMFNKAVEWELIDEQVAKKLAKCKKLKGENKRLRYLSEEESERLISNCDKNLKPIVITALNTGMRRGEILGLTWDRVDLKNRIILLDKTKNGERREIPINNTLYNTLSGLIRHIKTDYVFYNPETLKPYCDLKKGFGTALKKSNIVDFHFHDLRHTFASWLVMKGVDLATVQKLLGHKDIKMTLRYSHLSQAHIKEAIKVLDGLKNKKARFEHAMEFSENVETGKAL